MDATLRRWSAQAGSWRSALDFRIRTEHLAAYEFLPRAADFYVSLVGEFFDLIRDPDHASIDDLLATARTLAFFALEPTASRLPSAGRATNTVLAASLYYLADYSANARFLVGRISGDQITSDAEAFLWSFFNRTLLKDLPTSVRLQQFFREPSRGHLEGLIGFFDEQARTSFDISVDDYLPNRLASLVLRRFGDRNVWHDLLVFDGEAHWKPYVDLATTEKRPLWEFFPSQRQALGQNVLRSSASFSLQMPTSAGKTALCELLIYDHHRRNPQAKSLFLAPFRSLATELRGQFKLTKNRVDLITHLMAHAFESQQAGAQFGVLDVRNARLYCASAPDRALHPLLVGEAASFASMYESLS